MSEDQLMDLIRKTVLEWAMEEHLANQDDESHLTLHDRYQENAITFIQNVREHIAADLDRLQELPT